MQVTIVNMIAGVIVDGQSKPITTITTEGAQVQLGNGPKTLRINVSAVEDYDALEFALKFDDLSGLTVVDPVFYLSEEEFDVISRDDTFKNEYWFSVTEKNPGAHNMIGDMSVLAVTLERINGSIHIYITVE